MTRTVISCEHGGNFVPEDLLPLFKRAEPVLASHRGWDIGALDLYHRLAPLADHGAFETLSRLCIEMNRSIGHPKLFSPFTKRANERQRAELLRKYHAYRDPILAAIGKYIEAGDTVLHLSVHSFTPVLNGKERTVDIGLLYDPSRISEVEFCEAWRKEMEQALPEVKVRMNQPYKGSSDGFTTALRKAFPKHYSGIEFEVNQRFARNGKMDTAIKDGVSTSLEAMLRE